MKENVTKLTGAQETLLLPLWARAIESKRTEPVVLDEAAEKLVESIDYDFSKFEKMEKRFLGFCIRSSIFDLLVKELLVDRPDAIVAELGAGLDTRFQRLDNGQLTCFEIDFPEVIRLRRKFFEVNERRVCLEGSIIEPDTLAPIHSHVSSFSPPIFVAEGVLYFLNRAQVIELFGRLASEFPGCSIIFDGQSPWYLWLSNLMHPLKASTMTWSLQSAEKLEALDPRFQLSRYVCFGDSPYYTKNAMSRLPFHQKLARRLVPATRHAFKICRLDFTEAK